MNKGPLVRVTWPDGHVSKMYEADAIAQGLIAKPKARPQAENKMVAPAANKTAPVQAAEPVEPAEPDDFTEIPGIGKAVARSLAARGITSFAQLRAASDLSFLSKKAQAAVDTWKNA